MKQYIRVINRIVSACEHKSTHMGDEPKLSDLVSQLSIRAQVLAIASARTEIAAVKAVIKAARMRDDILEWPEGVFVRPWMERVKFEEFLALHEAIEAPYQELIDRGDALLKAAVSRVYAAGTDLSMDELPRVLAGCQVVERKKQPGQKQQKFINDRDLMALEMALSQSDVLQSIDSLHASKRTNVEGILRLFVNVMYFSGMRPAEVWNCLLMVPRIDLEFTEEMRALIENDPTEAIHRDLMMTVEDVSQATGDTLGSAAYNAMTRAAAPSVLVIKSAKTTNQNPDLRHLARVQILKKIPLRQLHIISAATQLRTLRLAERRRDNLRATMTRTLKRLCEDIPRLSDRNVNLYSFRHSFASRAKLTMTHAEAAALTGHTARASLYGYGQSNLRKSKSPIRSEWMPSADPKHAALIKATWEAAAKTSPEPALEG